jgi:DNA-directed RNA polymerase specialized sigma24 family protein
MERTVTDEEVAAYRKLAASVARRYTGMGGAEFDDLEQEAWIKIWEVLKTGFWGPSALVVERACINYVKVCQRRGIGGYEPLPEQ